MQLQNTLKKSYTFCGQGLHTGKKACMTLCPAPENTGILFRRVDLPGRPEVPALAEYVTNTARSTTLSKGECTVVTTEHLLAALTGLGVDNCIVEIDNDEVPILDGSAKLYTDAIAPDGLQQQDCPRQYITLEREIRIENEANGSMVCISPAQDTVYDMEVDFNSEVVGVQTANWTPLIDFCGQFAPCRTFVFFHELEALLAHNLIKGGDVDNAIVIVGHAVSREQIDRVSAIFGKTDLNVGSDGYLSNVTLNFPNECARHKMLDLIGDLRLCGGFLKAKVTAVRSGHTINTGAAKAVRQLISNK